MMLAVHGRVSRARLTQGGFARVHSVPRERIRNPFCHHFIVAQAWRKTYVAMRRSRHLAATTSARSPRSANRMQAICWGKHWLPASYNGQDP